ncbi:MAG TPA: hypothetical protein VFG15_03675 [Amycolatopsis sp.]|nr:hypothetical protein [Amycolatopsis sp.]
MVSRLPITIPPAHRELAVSYLARLAALHELPAEDLWRQASRNRRLDGDRLTILASQPRARLGRAIVELLDPEPDWLALRHEPQRGCRRCTAAHPGGPVLQLLGHHDYVCTRHRIWIGPPDLLDHPQPSLAALPEVIAAQHRHRRLLARLGPAATFDAVLTGFLFCAHHWNFTNTDTTADGDAFLDWRRRAQILIPPGTETDTFSASRLFAATYPEAVKVAEVLAPLYWRRLAAGGPDDQAAFAAAIGARLGLRDYRPSAAKDPIAHWIEDDCWRPPSLPHRTFRGLRTFGGPTGARKADKNAEGTRQTSARWFTRHHRGGDAMLHHRTLTPVILRDWSIKMELFTGALVLTTNTSTASQREQGIQPPRGVHGASQLTVTHWSRPQPRPSRYLALAIEPVPWPDRDDGYRPPAGGRRLVDSEKRLAAATPVPINPLRSSLGALIDD